MDIGGSPRRRGAFLESVAVLAVVAVVLAVALGCSARPAVPARRPASTVAGSAPVPPRNPGCGPTYARGTESWPDCATSGVPRDARLKPESGELTIRKNGTVINHVNLAGSIDIYANNVTIENSNILSSGYWGIYQRPGYSGLNILNNTVTGNVGRGPDSGGEDIGVWAQGDDITIARNNISEFGGNLNAGTGNIYGNYLHDEQAFGSTGIGGCNPLPHPIGRCYNHSDAFGIDAGRGIDLHDNTILEARIPGATSAVELDDDLGVISDVRVTGNFIAGGDYCTYAGSNPDSSPSAHIIYQNNYFSTLYYPNCGQYGPVAYWNPAGEGSVWSGNYWADGPLAGRELRQAAS